MRFSPVLIIAAIVPIQLAAASPLQSGKTIPAKFHGEWARDQAQCRSRGGENSAGFKVTAKAITYYESTEDVLQVQTVDRNTVRYTATLASADGDEPSQGELKLSADGKRLIGKAHDGDLVRCA